MLKNQRYSCRCIFCTRGIRSKYSCVKSRKTRWVIKQQDSNERRDINCTIKYITEVVGDNLERISPMCHDIIPETKEYLQKIKQKIKIKTPKVKQEINKIIYIDCTISELLTDNEKLLLTKLRRLKVSTVKQPNDILKYAYNQRLVKKYSSKLKNKLKKYVVTFEDKGKKVVICSKRWYYAQINDFIHQNFSQIGETCDKRTMKQLPHCYGLVKTHGKYINNPKLRVIVAYPKQGILNKALELKLRAKSLRKELLQQPDSNYIVSLNNVHSKILDMKNNNLDLITYDIEGLYSNLEHKHILEAINYYTPNHFKYIEQVLNNTFLIYNNCMYQQKKGVPMGNPLSPYLADITLKYIEKNISQKNFYRYVDDIIIGTYKQDKVENLSDIYKQYNLNLIKTTSNKFLNINLQNLQLEHNIKNYWSIPQNSYHSPKDTINSVKGLIKNMWIIKDTRLIDTDIASKLKSKLKMKYSIDIEPTYWIKDFLSNRYS